MAGGNDRLQLVIDLAQAEIALQFAAAVGFDSQAIGILLFDSAIAGTLIAVASFHPSPVEGSWGFPLAGLAVSAAFAFGTATLGRLKAGPRLSEFLVKILRLQGETATAEAQEAAVTDLIETIRINRRVLRRKEVTLGVGLVLLAVTFVGYGTYAGLGLLGRFSLWAGGLLAGVMSSHGQLAGLLIVGCLAILMVWIYAREG